MQNEYPTEGRTLFEYTPQVFLDYPKEGYSLRVYKPYKSFSASAFAGVNSVVTMGAFPKFAFLNIVAVGVGQRAVHELLEPSNIPAIPSGVALHH